jgi:hypothetical protein
MPNYVKYLLTVDADTGAPVKIEQVGESGELIREVSVNELQPAVPSSGTVIVNIYAGGQAPTQTTVAGTSRLSSGIMMSPGIMMGSQSPDKDTGSDK